MTPNQNSWLIMNLHAFIQTNDFITVGKSPIATSYTLKYRGGAANSTAIKTTYSLSVTGCTEFDVRILDGWS